MLDFASAQIADEEIVDWPSNAPAEPPRIVQAGFQLPAGIWLAMLACYTVFIGAMAVVASGSSFAIFMVVISALYVVVFFGVARKLALLPGQRDTSPLSQGRPLETWCGPMSYSSVVGQVLIVPFGIALFGVSVAIIGALAGI